MEELRRSFAYLEMKMEPCLGHLDLQIPVTGLVEDSSMHLCYFSVAGHRIKIC